MICDIHLYEEELLLDACADIVIEGFCVLAMSGGPHRA